MCGIYITNIPFAEHDVRAKLESIKFRGPDYIGIKNIEVSFPSLPTQTRIASILSALDDKIELNNKALLHGSDSIEI